MKDSGSGCGKVVGAIGLIASLIGIFAFVSGKESIPDILGQDRVTFVATSKPQVFDAPPTESPSFTRKPTSTSSPPGGGTQEGTDSQAVLLSTQATNTPGPTRVTNTPRLNGSPRNWVADPDDLPVGMSQDASEETSNEDVAKYHDNPSEMFGKLQDWGRLEGYLVGYLADEYETTCSSETGLITITMQTILHHSAAGADGYLDYLTETEGERTSGIYREEKINVIGDRTHSVWFEFTDECVASEGNNSNWIGHQISFRRYNVLGSVYVNGVKGIIGESELESIAIHLARLIDLKLVAQLE